MSLRNRNKTGKKTGTSKTHLGVKRVEPSISYKVQSASTNDELIPVRPSSRPRPRAVPAARYGREADMVFRRLDPGMKAGVEPHERGWRPAVSVQRVAVRLRVPALQRCRMPLAVLPPLDPIVD